VTFRLRAPQARAVSVSGDFGPDSEMAKNADGIGKDDTAMKGAKMLHDTLAQARIEHTFLETEGAHHWRVWRRYLRDLAPLLFK
jgi:enterochelin esterase-like enzyme